jgi:RNA polymerase sigma-70 factor (ECF subfamily)
MRQSFYPSIPALRALSSCVREGTVSEPAANSLSRVTGDPETQFVQQNLRRIFLLIYRIVGNVDDAQDLTQEAFIKALQRQGQLKDLERSGQWLSKIAANTAIDFLRRRKRLSFSDINQLAGFPTPWADPEQSVLRGERKLHLDGGLAVLTERERMALMLRDVEDIPAEQVAKQMNCSMATVRSHIANARTKFKRYLDERKCL